MSSTPMTLADAGDSSALFANDADEFAVCSLPETFERAAEATRALVAAEAEALAEVAALCDSFEPAQVDSKITGILQALRLTIDQATEETRALLESLETLVVETSRLPEATEVETTFAKQLVEAARLYGSDAASMDLMAGADAAALPAGQKTTTSAFARVIAALDAMPAAVAVALESHAGSPRVAVAAGAAA